MNHSTSLIENKKPMRPLFYTHLITSTPDSHQITKRIKNLFGHFEHYKGVRKEGIDPGFPLKTENYRRSRELHLEFWNTLKKTKYLEKFLKSVKNVQKIHIRFCEEGFPYYQKGNPQKDAFEQLCKVLGKITWLQRIRIDFPRKTRNEIFSVEKGIRSLRFLAKLKDLSIKIDGEEAYPFSVGLLKAGFSFQNINPHETVMMIEDVEVIQKLMKRIPKIEQLDTIRGNVKWYVSEKFFESFAFAISKLPNLRELDFNSSACHDISLNRILKILDALLEAQKLEILKIGLQMRDTDQISLTPADFQKIFDLLQEISSLYELHLDFFAYIDIEDEVLEDYMEKISNLKGIRKLKIVFNYNESNFSARHAGNIIRCIFNKMPLLEELYLQLPKNCIDFAEDNGQDIQGLPRLKNVFISFKECDVYKEKSIWRMIEILGKCERLRELELDLTKSVYDGPETTRRLCENLAKLKELQVFSLHTNELLVPNGEENPVGLLLDFVRTFEKMRNLQDFHLDIKTWPYRGGGVEKYYELRGKLKNSTKYRFFYLGYYE